MTKKVLILGANGFIGSHLTEKLLATTDYQVVGLDLDCNKLGDSIGNPRFDFKQADMLNSQRWIEEKIQQCDTILPLVAIATPATYVQDPLRVFHLDFEANLAIIKQVVQYKKRLIFPSTSEVYGMCQDAQFDEQRSNFVLGPIHKQRWIYSCSKQMLDRVIYAYGTHHDLDYTLFRPFNWIGPRQDDPQTPNPRVLTQFIGNIIRGETIKLVDGGQQRRTFLYIDDGIDCLTKIIINQDACAKQQIFNIGNPDNNYSIAELAEMALHHAKQCNHKKNHRLDRVKVVTVDSSQHYGTGYQDVAARVPAIQQAQQYLSWQPTTTMNEAVRQTVEYYLNNE